MTDDARPFWSFDFPEPVARFVHHGHVVGIRHEWEFTSEDTADHWVVLCRNDGKEMKVECRWFSLYWSGQDALVFEPYHAGLIKLPDRYRDLLERIDRWDVQHKRDRAEFERLSRMFGVKHGEA